MFSLVCWIHFTSQSLKQKQIFFVLFGEDEEFWYISELKLIHV